jgi:hypothetical protein
MLDACFFASLRPRRGLRDFLTGTRALIGGAQRLVRSYLVTVLPASRLLAWSVQPSFTDKKVQR